MYDVVLTELYEQILDTIASFSKVMEQRPEAYTKHGEEDLRHLILAQLNDQYGAASGETFNYKGKTDILIQQEGERLFVAECKIWDGDKVLTDAISQLLDLYVTWRDTKTAVVVFSRRKNFTNVLNQIPGIAKKHPYFDSAVRYGDESRFRFLFKNPDDEQRKVTVTVLAFNVPAEDPTAHIA